MPNRVGVGVTRSRASAGFPIMKGTWKENLYSASFAILAVFAVAQTLANHVNILVPIYGSAASRLHLENVLRVSTILAITTPSKIAIRVAGLCSAAAPLMLVLPTLTHWIAAYSARFRHPVWGACSAHVTTWLPISYIFIVTVLVHVSRSNRWQSVLSMLCPHHSSSSTYEICNQSAPFAGKLSWAE
jgi:hypothetical protein